MLPNRLKYQKTSPRRSMSSGNRGAAGRRFTAKAQRRKDSEFGPFAPSRLCGSLNPSDLPSPADAGFAKAGAPHAKRRLPSGGFGFVGARTYSGDRSGIAT